jgi:hypothetical protein
MVSKMYVHYCSRGNQTKSFDNRLTFPRAIFAPHQSSSPPLHTINSTHSSASWSETTFCIVFSNYIMKYARAHTHTHTHTHIMVKGDDYGTGRVRTMYVVERGSSGATKRRDGRGVIAKCQHKIPLKIYRLLYVYE